MVQQQSNGDGFFTAVPFDAEGCAATVETDNRMVVLHLVGPLTVVAVTLARREARALALTMVDASQHITTYPKGDT